MRKLYVMLPCYNEEENIGVLIDKWLAEEKKLISLHYSLKIVGIDDKSTDHTLSILCQKKVEHDNILIISHDKNFGLGGGVQTAFLLFLNEGNKNDYCVLMDGDNSHDPKYIFSMLEKIADCDCVIASRYCAESLTKGVPFYRMLLTYFAKLYYKILLHVPRVNDYTCGYRLYRYEILQKAYEKYGVNFVTRKSFACMMEVLYKLHLVGCRFEEVPFELRYDEKKGQSKMRLLSTIKESVTTALKLSFHV